MECTAAGACRERALSEVIGFVLILGIIMAAFSLYLVYGVPVQGRENEINHMNVINDQFVSYKIGVDSLWTNQQTGLAMSTTFPLGTAGQTAQGSTSIIPVLQPIGSSGVLAINQRTTTPEIFTVSSASYISNTTSTSSGSQVQITTSSASQAILNAPSSLQVNLSTTNAFWNNTAPGSVLINGSTWSATINITPDISDCLTTGSGNNVTYLTSCYGSDVTATVVKNGITTLNRAVIYSNIKPGSIYSINLLDAAYGIQSSITYPATLYFSKYDPSSQLTTATATAQYAYQQQTNYTYSVPLGSLEYSTNNNYWIPQTYYYQMGGVFLSQSDGITYKLPPEITFLNNGNGNVTISIVAIAYDPADSGAIGGSSPAQISTSLDSNAGSLPYAPINLNTWNASINITTPDPNAAVMWAAYLNAAANQTGGIPTSLYAAGNTTNGSYINFPGTSPHITLSVKTANLTASVQSVGSL
ncbi:hypothetical protein Mboo_2133 [Methanoregula boonei 6A8]|jgi:hypothetical protein|uniref:Uncharacterized protein n=1 Tax=Methanoregula boonei (strain DSM 21154 / JCM 14090 / 6A8) TaxID=456442 RepID=A7IA86_METB6|nr:hypothetical protein [Methanoregula boonei]ABS56647.1 hypothetical protein Mboo_2133 [Methanoregula boonei 6A8]